MYILFSCTVTQISKWVSLEGSTRYCLVQLPYSWRVSRSTVLKTVSSQFLGISGEGGNICIKIDIATWYCCIFCVSLILGWLLKNKFIFHSEHCDLTSSFSVVFCLFFYERSCQLHFIRVFLLFFHLYIIVLCVVCQYLLHRSDFLPYSVFRFRTSMYLYEKPWRVYMRQY